MKTGVRPLVLWGLGVGAIAVLGVLVFGLGTLPALLLAGAAAGAVLTGVVAGVRGRGEGASPGSGRSVAEPEASPSAVVCAVGATMALTGLVVGQVFLLLGLGLLLLGAAGLRVERSPAGTLPPGAPTSTDGERLP